MSNCPNCWQPLIGVPGAPTEAYGAFPADCRCPECGAVTPAGARVFAGTRDSVTLGTRWGPGKLLLLLVLGLALSFHGSDALLALVAALRGNTDALGMGFVQDLAFTLLFGAILGRLVVWKFLNNRRSKPAEVTEAVTAREAWMVLPGRLVVLSPPDGTGVAADGAEPAAVLRPFDAAPAAPEAGALPLPPSARFLIDAADVRTVDVSAERSARHFKGNIVRLALQPVRAPRQWPAAMYLATDHAAARIASIVRQSLHAASPSDGGAAEASSQQAPEIAADGVSRPQACALHADMIEVRGRPFPPRLINDGDPARRSGLAWVVFVLALWIAVITVGLRFPATRGIRLGISIFCLVSLVRAVYLQFRATTVRWQATPGTLRIDRYRYFFTPIWPTTRLISGESIEAVRVVERDGMPMLEVYRRNRRKPLAAILPDDLGRFEPQAVAAAIESMVRRAC